jgi:hypothetical protein
MPASAAPPLPSQPRALMSRSAVATPPRSSTTEHGRAHHALTALDAPGDTYVEASGGDDANDCLSVQKACLTVQAAVDKAAAGGTVHVGAGDYPEHVFLSSGSR